MKVSFGGKIRKLRSFPTSMAELRKEISRKFTERNLLDDEDLKESRMSTILESQDSLMSFISQSKS